jgi:secreted trypsin-like serine protease
MLYVARLFQGTLILVTLAISVGCTKDNYSTSSIPAAAGRFSAVTTDFPGVVMVILPGNKGLCTGSIVSPRAVLTATHCLKTAGTYTVRSKNGDFQTNHVAYAGTGSVEDTHDIGLLIFDNVTLTNFNDEVYPIATKANVGDAVTLVGFGCSSVETKTGSGVKRAGTNRINTKDDYLNLLTPKSTSARGIIGDANQAGTCFGDSGGPLFVTVNGKLQIAGVTHAGGTYGNYYLSEFTNVADQVTNRSFLANVDAQYNLNIDGI